MSLLAFGLESCVNALLKGDLTELLIALGDNGQGTKSELAERACRLVYGDNRGDASGTWASTSHQTQRVKAAEHAQARHLLAAAFKSLQEADANLASEFPDIKDVPHVLDAAVGSASRKRERYIDNKTHVVICRNWGFNTVTSKCVHESCLHRPAESMQSASGTDNSTSESSTSSDTRRCSSSNADSDAEQGDTSSAQQEEGRASDEAIEVESVCSDGELLEEAEYVEHAIVAAASKLPNPWPRITKDNLEDLIRTVLPYTATVSIGWQENRFIYRSSVEAVSGMPSELEAAKQTVSWGKRGGQRALSAVLDYSWERHQLTTPEQRPAESELASWPDAVLKFLEDIPTIKGYYATP